MRINVEPMRIIAAVLDEPDCDDPIGPPPRCTFAQIWAKTLARKAPRDLGAKIGWRPKQAWSFDIELEHSQRIALTIKDGC